MKALVVYYSRTGNTRQAATAVAARLGADLEELREAKDRSGLLGYLEAGREAMLKAEACLLPTMRDPAAYELVVLAQPVWAFTAIPAMRTYVRQHRQSLGKVALLATQDSTGARQTFAAMEGLLGRRSVASLALNSKTIRNNQMEPPLDEFIAAITAHS